MRALEVLRSEGPHSLGFRVLGELGYRRMIVMERTFDLSMPEVDPGFAVTFAPLEPDEIDDYLRLRPDHDPDDVRDRFRRRHVCFGARLDGRLVQVCWVGAERVSIDYLDCWMHLGSGIGYLHDLYTLPDLRGRNLHRAMYPHMFRYFRNTGCPAVMAAFHPENRVQRIFGRLGFRPVALGHAAGFGPLRRVWQRPLPEAGSGPIRFRLSLSATP
jgi:GNAT superfamily N-acetyltransferase